MFILLNNLLMCLLLLVFILLSVTFLTLFEQKVLSYIQIRKGPNKVGFMGIFQPFCDALKLFTKEFTIPVFSNYLIYYFSPVISLILSLIVWMSFPFMFKFLSFKLGFLFLLSCLSMGVYLLMFSGWSSNSNYSLLGSLRAIAQSISYEVCMVFIMLLFFIKIFSMNFFFFFFFQKYLSMVYLNFIISFILLVIFFAETNRSPFDFSEGESELVSGFNIEYSSGGFALIFLSEYSSILFLSFFYCMMFLMKNLFFIWFFFKMSFISFMFIWVRGSYPRYRYDKLMYLTWKSYLPFSLNFFIFFVSLKVILFFFI